MAYFIQGEVTDCDSFQIPLLTNWVGCMKHKKKAVSISSKFQHKVRIELLKNAAEATAYFIQGEVTDCDSFQISVLTNWVKLRNTKKQYQQ